LPHLRRNRCSRLQDTKQQIQKQANKIAFRLKKVKYSDLTLPLGFLSLLCHFHNLWIALEPRANSAIPLFVYNKRTTCGSEK
jgi:hypothetical protein